MKFCLVDRVLEQGPERIVAVKHVSLAEEYLQDHFPGFPVLPGVLMLEAMVQAARRLVTAESGDRVVLGGVHALKYGAMVRPGEVLRVEVTTSGPDGDGVYKCRGTGIVRRDDESKSEETAVSGRFTMRPVRRN
ncbi:MAG: beta-hydroxyacyl-ACP dehydratase [Phycisphaerales bacterium]|nr:polyketide synthase dehydratase domain-containing protein [Phycisphaerae bacterium]NNM27277.1 beta-hydroxyacyl-ACP dehydratase [Phycisphaerales bacterium]